MNKSFCTASLLSMLALSGCMDMEHNKTTQPVLNISYPAAYVVNAEGNSLSVIELATQQVKETISFGSASTSTMPGNTTMPGMIMWPHHIYLSPDGNKLGVGVPGMDLSGGHAGGTTGMKGRVLVVDPKTGQTSQNQQTPVMNHNAVFSADGTEIWTSQMDDTGKVLVYNAATMALKNTIPVGKEPAEVTMSSNGLLAFVANGMSNSVTVIKVADKSVVKTIAVGEDPVGAWPGADGKMYVDNEKGKSISVIDVATLAVTETVQLGFTPGYAAYNQLRNELWVSRAGTGNKVVIFEYMNGGWMNMGEVATGLDAHAIAFTKDGLTAYVTNQGAATVSIIDVVKRTKVKDITVGKKPNGIVFKY